VFPINNILKVARAGAAKEILGEKKASLNRGVGRLNRRHASGASANI